MIVIDKKTLVVAFLTGDVVCYVRCWGPAIHSFTLVLFTLCEHSTCYSPSTPENEYELIKSLLTRLRLLMTSSVPPTLGNSFLLEQIRSALQLVNKNYGLLKRCDKWYIEKVKREHTFYRRTSYYTLCFFTIIVGPCLSLVLHYFVFVLCAKFEFERRHLQQTIRRR